MLDDEAVDPSIQVVMSSFTSEQLRAAISPNSPHFEGSNKFLSGMLTRGRYDVADLHFYGCVEDIPVEVQWVKAHMPPGKSWISTENGGPDIRCPSTPVSWEQNPEEYERLQARQVSERLSACADSGGLVCLWFSFLDMTGETSVFTHMGLIDPRALKDKVKQLKGRRQTSDRRPVETLSQDQRSELAKLLRKKAAYAAFKSFTATHR